MFPRDVAQSRSVFLSFIIYPVTMRPCQWSKSLSPRVVVPAAHRPAGAGDVPLQGGRGQPLRPRDDAAGRVQERLPVRVQRQGGAAGECGDLLRVRLPVPRLQCTQVCVQW